MLLDPTLDSCCRRDLEDQKKTAQLKSKLLSLDRTNQRLKHGSILLSTQPHGQKPLESHAAERDASDEDSDFGSNDEEAPDPQIERLRQMRIEEMKRKAQADSQASSLGYGCVNELHWRQVVHKAEEVGGYCICHLSVDGHEVSSSSSRGSSVFLPLPPPPLPTCYPLASLPRLLLVLLAGCFISPLPSHPFSYPTHSHAVSWTRSSMVYPTSIPKHYSSDLRHVPQEEAMHPH